MGARCRIAYTRRGKSMCSESPPIHTSTYFQKRQFSITFGVKKQDSKIIYSVLKMESTIIKAEYTWYMAISKLRTDRQA